ncbi:Sec-independent protein translocase protein TatB [Cardiobacterium hominis]
MFDIGFSELVVLGVIGVVVIGPQRLPEVVRTAVITVRKIRRAFSDVRADIERELDLDDMRKILHEADMKAYINQLNQDIMGLDKGARALGDDIKTDLEHAYDGYTPEDGEAEADTGVEPPRPTETTAVTTDAAAPETPEKEPEK